MFRSFALLGMVVLATGVVALARLNKGEARQLPADPGSRDKATGLPGPVARRMPAPLYHAPFSMN